MSGPKLPESTESLLADCNTSPYKVPPQYARPSCGERAAHMIRIDGACATCATTKLEPRLGHCLRCGREWIL